MSGSAVKVAVRVRPFNSSEIDQGCKCVVKVQDHKQMTITDPGSRKEHSFTFDFAYWSHNEKDENFVSQEKVFEDLGLSVLDNAFQGLSLSFIKLVGYYSTLLCRF